MLRSFNKVLSILPSNVVGSPRHPALPGLTKRAFATIDVEDDRVSIPSLSAAFPYIWLRDSCQCATCVHPSTRQKLHRSSDFSLSTRPVAVETQSNPDGLRVEWEKDHTSFYPKDFLSQHSTSAEPGTLRWDSPAVPWTAEHFASLTKVPYGDLEKEGTLAYVYESLARYGLVLFENMPNANTSNESCEVRALARKIGEIRNTFYGETWDVRNVQNSKNIAYTNLYLGFHMDLLYFKDPPRYQILHCLRNRVQGGHSIFVDGLNAALKLHKSFPEDFALLASTPVKFHYVNDAHHLHCSHNTFQLQRIDPATAPSAPHVVHFDGVPHEIASINYSPPFQAPLALSTPRAFYGALGRYAALLDDAALRFSTLLREGDAVLFDNRRVLHGRTAFAEYHAGAGAPTNGETNRWLKGCYLEEESVLDRRRTLNAAIRERGGSKH